MGTKNNPGTFDCLEKAEADEPFFVLLARDPVGAHFVRMWAMLREDDFENAKITFDDLVLKLFNQHHRTKLRTPDEIEERERNKVKEANECSAAMRAWIKTNRPQRVL